MEQHWSEIFERTAVGYATAYDQLSEQVKPNPIHFVLISKLITTITGSMNEDSKPS